MLLYRVVWKDTFGGALRRSDPMPLYLAEFQVRYRTEAEPNFRYWIERCEVTVH